MSTNCQICDAEEAVFTIIPVGEGDPQVLGAACFARSGLELAKAILPAEEIAATLGPMFVGPAAAAAELDATPKRSTRKAKPAPQVGAESDSHGDSAEGAEEAGTEATATEAG